MSAICWRGGELAVRLWTVELSVQSNQKCSETKDAEEGQRELGVPKHIKNVGAHGACITKQGYWASCMKQSPEQLFVQSLFQIWDSSRFSQLAG